MGMAKIPTRMSWVKITWHRKKKKKRKERKIKTISKWLILSLWKLNDAKLSHSGFGTF